MFKKIFMIVLMILISFSAFAGAKGDNWSFHHQVETDVKNFYTAFIDERIGFTGGHLHALIRSDDGGNNWSAIYPESEHGIRFDMDFLSEDQFFSANTGGLDFTEDGGRSWNRLLDQQFDYISFADRQNGWCQSKDQLFRTEDGGIQWDIMDLPQNFEQAFGVSAFSYEEAVVLTRDGLLHFTQDGGANWDSKNLNDMLSRKGYRPRFSTSALRFVSREHGMIVVMDRSEPYQWLICETLDGGQRWTISTVQMEDTSRPEISMDLNVLSFMEPTEVDPDIFLFKRDS